jgi:nucleotide-binding universal stress UspA family protein
MMQLRTIIVAAALDERDATTLQHAGRIARATGASELYLAQVAPHTEWPTELGGLHPAPVSDEGEIEAQLTQLLDAHRKLLPDGAQIQRVMRRGVVVTELARLAAQHSADLVCIGRRLQDDHDPLTESAVKLVRKAPCSVFVVPQGAPAQYRTILVPIDFSDRSADALQLGVCIAGASPGASITVQHVYSVPVGYHKTGRSYEEFAQTMRRLAEQEWASWLPRLDFRGVPWSMRFDLGDKAPKAILAAADEIHADLMVMGSHGRTRPSTVLLGHAADSVCSKTARPLLCVKQKGEVVHLLRALLEVFDMG